MRWSILLVGPAMLILAVGCRCLPPWLLAGGRQDVRAYQPPPPPGYAWLDVPYSDNDAFDTLMDNYLVSNKPAIRIVLDTKAPDWSSRINAWLKAYQAGGKVRAAGGKGGLDQLLWLAASAQTPTEARELLEHAFDRLEGYAKAGAAWWANEQQRQRRVELLRPYNLDAVREKRRGGKYAILLYNGCYDGEQ